jgi:hypothetical protein
MTNKFYVSNFLIAECRRTVVVQSQMRSNYPGQYYEYLCNNGRVEIDFNSSVKVSVSRDVFALSSIRSDILDLLKEKQ